MNAERERELLEKIDELEHKLETSNAKLAVCMEGLDAAEIAMSNIEVELVSGSELAIVRAALKQVKEG
jgi:hypothetical protein